MAESAPSLAGVRFAVLALGDTAYTNFCATGRAVDERLEALGATRIVDRVDLDLDFAKKAAAWIDGTLTTLQPVVTEQPTAGNIVHVDFKSAAPASEPDEPAFDAENPLEAEITEIVNLNGTGSTSETWHVELASDAIGWNYAPGDAIGVLPQNDPQLVAQILDVAGLAGDVDLETQLISERDVTTLTRPIIQAYAKLTGRSDVEALAAPERFAAYAKARQIIDLLAEHREKLTPAQLVGLLRPLPPRLYSVASSLAVHSGETHLLLSAVRWQSHGRARNGVASTWLAGKKRGDVARLYVKLNRHSCDFFCVGTITFRMLYVFFAIDHASRQVLHVHVTPYLTASWATQQIVECCAWDRKPPRFLVHDRDSCYGATFHRRAGARIDRWHNGRHVRRNHARFIEATKLERSSRYLCSEAFITFVSKSYDDVTGSNFLRLRAWSTGELAAAAVPLIFSIGP